MVFWYAGFSDLFDPHARNMSLCTGIFLCMQEFQEAVGGVVNVSFTAARDGIMAVSMPVSNYPEGVT